MEFERPFSVESIVEIAQIYFPFITNENFSTLFKLSPEIISKQLVWTSKNSIRDFLILLYWLKHGHSTRILGVLFNLKKSRIAEIIRHQLVCWSEKATAVITLENGQIFEPFFLDNVIGAVDGTEFQINAWIGDAYSGKQGYVYLFTVHFSPLGSFFTCLQLVITPLNIK
jgi:hypothetical protein